MTARGETARLRAWLAALDPLQRALCGVAAALAIACVVLLASWRRTPEATATVPMPPEPPGLAEAPGPDTPFAYDVIVERNAFTASRSAPARPWGLTLAVSAADEGAAAEEPPAEPPPPVSYRLYGTVLRGSAGSFALIEADPETPGPERYEVGARVGRHRLLRIEPTRVVLSGGMRLELGDDEDGAGVGGPE